MQLSTVYCMTYACIFMVLFEKLCFLLSFFLDLTPDWLPVRVFYRSSFGLFGDPARIDGVSFPLWQVV